jgi:hypothetical protein
MGDQIASTAQGMTKEKWISLISMQHTPASEKVF